MNTRKRNTYTPAIPLTGYTDTGPRSGNVMSRVRHKINVVWSLRFKKAPKFIIYRESTTNARRDQRKCATLCDHRIQLMRTLIIRIIFMINLYKLLVSARTTIACFGKYKWVFSHTETSRTPFGGKLRKSRHFQLAQKSLPLQSINEMGKTTRCSGFFGFLSENRYN